jgi:predicted nuclease of predicted toxin-antitoxin system
VRFLVDTQLPKALAVRPSELRHETEHVLDIGLAQSKDTPVWRYAQQKGAVVVTKDEDFAEWVRRGRPGPAVVWLRDWEFVETRLAGVDRAVVACDRAAVGTGRPPG